MMDTYYGNKDIHTIIRENIQLRKDTAGLNETAIHLRNEYEKQQIQIKGILEQNEILKEQNKIITEKYNKILEEINKIKEEKRETKYKN